jgi:hypothetical protein
MTDKNNKIKTNEKVKLLKKLKNKFALYQNNKKGGIALILKKVKYKRPIGYFVVFSNIPKSVLNFKAKKFKD